MLSVHARPSSPSQGTVTHSGSGVAPSLGDASLTEPPPPRAVPRGRVCNERAAPPSAQLSEGSGASLWIKAS